jgi:DeoR/GlpR family transcriptional regulator of sugar metabolism
MYPAERRQEILRLVQHDARVTVAQLAAHFGVSRASIRRDLNELHRSGLLQRMYGGALATGAAARGGDLQAAEEPFSARQVSHYGEKERIGCAAAALVSPGQVIFVDGGTTCECLVPYLAGKPYLTVVTYGFNIVTRLVPLEDITVIVIGGTLHRRSLTLGGVLAQDSLLAYNMRFDMAFVAASGISAEAGMTNASFEEIPMKRRAIEAARQAILLADCSKVGIVAAGQVAAAGQIARLITGAEAPVDEVERLRQLGMTVDLV